MRAAAISFIFMCGAALAFGQNPSFKTVKIGGQLWMAENLNTETAGGSCYNYSREYCNRYGKLYSWAAAMRACPQGWRLPSDADWDRLLAHLGGEDKAGTALKQEHDSGFGALLGGMSDSHGFNLINFCGAYWSSSSQSKTHAWYYYLNNKDGLVTKTYFSKSYGFSVRCIKNE